MDQAKYYPSIGNSPKNVLLAKCLNCMRPMFWRISTNLDQGNKAKFTRLVKTGNCILIKTTLLEADSFGKRMCEGRCYVSIENKGYITIPKDNLQKVYSGLLDSFFNKVESQKSYEWNPSVDFFTKWSTTREVSKFLKTKISCNRKLLTELEQLGYVHSDLKNGERVWAPNYVDGYRQHTMVDYYTEK